MICKHGIDVKVKNFETKIINGRKLNVKANVEISVSVYANNEFEIITGINKVENIELLSNTQKINSLIGRGENKVVLKDTVAIDVADDLAEIMNVDFKIIDEETKISYNKVLSKADAVIHITYLTEDNRINTITTIIPIMGFVDMPDIKEGANCEIQNALSNLIIKPNGQDEHSIYIEAEINITCLAYEDKEINMIEDLYSTEDEIDFTKEQINIVLERNEIKDVYRIKENLRIPEMTGKVINVQINNSINSEQIRRGKVLYEGNIRLGVLFEQNSSVTLREIDLPFSFEVSSDKIEENSNIETILKINQNDFIVKDGVIEVSIGIEFKVIEQKNKKLNIIKEIKVEPVKNLETYSMIIYFVKPGDTLWKIAKKFKSTVENIAEINDIENPDKINAGQQLYIPRICKRKIAV